MRIAAILLGLFATVVLAQDCQLVVPNNALTAAGLATPYILQTTANSNTGCKVTTADTGPAAFIHAVIVDALTGQLNVYSPLMINLNTKPLVTPITPTLTANAVVGIWFGYNGATLTLVNAAGTTSVTQANCVNGATINGKLDTFSQYAYCNAPAFYNAVNNLIKTGKITVPALGTAPDGKPCPNVRSFDMIDMDQSDNVPTVYLLDPATGLLAQFNTANAKNFPKAIQVSNPSDNALVVKFMWPALGTACTNGAWMVPDLSNPGQMSSALPLNEIQAGIYQPAPQALVSLNHAFCTVAATTGAFSTTKVNLYRAGVNQPQISTTVNKGQADPATFCRNLNGALGATRLQGFAALYRKGTSPVAGFANLNAFLANRFTTANQILDCANLIGKANVKTVNA